MIKTFIICSVTFCLLYCDVKVTASKRRKLYTQCEVTSQSLWSRYDRHFVGIT